MIRLAHYSRAFREIVVDVTITLGALMVFTWMAVGTALFLGMIL